MIRNGASPFSSVFLNSHAMTSATTMPKRYIDNMVNPVSFRKPRTVTLGMQAAINNVYTGSLAEQLISGDTRIVTSRSLGVSMVLVAMIPGIAQANELSMGM